MSVKKLRWRYFFAMLSILLGSISLAVYILLATATGTRWMLSQIEQYIPISTEQAEGSLINGLRAHKLDISLPSLAVKAENILINLDLWPLLFNQELKISELTIGKLTVMTLPTGEATESSIDIPALPALPISAHLKRLKIDSIALDENPELSFSSKEILLNKQQLTWSELKIAIQNSQINSNGRWRSDLLQQTIETTTTWQWQDFTGSLDVKGPFENLSINQQLLGNVNVANTTVKFALASEGIISVNNLETINFDIKNTLQPISIYGADITQVGLSIKGDLQQFEALISSMIDHPETGLIDANLSAKGEYLGAIKSTLKAKLLGGSLELNSLLDNVQSLNLANKLRVTSLNFQKLPSYSLEQGLITNIVTNVDLSLNDPSFPWKIKSINVDGIFNDKPFTLSATGSGNLNQAKIENISFSQAADSIKARLAINEKRIEGNANVLLTDLQHYIPNGRGSIDLQTSFNSQLDNIIEQSKLTIQAKSETLGFGEFTLGNLNIIVNTEGKAFKADLQSGFVQSDNVAFANLSQHWTGHLDKQHINIDGTGAIDWIYKGQSIAIPEQTISINWEKDSNEWAKVFLRAADNNIVLDGQVSLAKDNTLHGLIKAHTLNLEWLKTFSPNIDELQGAINLSAQLAGSVDNPKLTSSIKLNAEKAKFIDPNFALNSIDIQGDVLPDWSFTLQGVAKQKDRPINLSGSGWLLGENAPQISFHLDAENLKADTPKVEIAISPNVDLSLANNQLKVRGEITIPSADIEISKLPNPSYSTSPDVVVIGRKEKKSTSSLSHDVDIFLTVADNVVIKAAGMSTKLKGKLHVKAQTDKPNLVQGKLNLVDGSIDSNGQALSIKQGELIFSGSSDNPAIDIIAIRKIVDPKLEVGIHVTGTLKRMQTDIISFPSIDQSRALSFLAFGKDISKSSSGDTDSNAQLMSAAVSLGIGQSSALIQNLRRSTGLDELAAVANDSGSASLIAGKQISNKLFARYRYDMAEAIGVLLLRYQLNNQWSLEAESGNDTSIDVLYRLGD